MKYHKMAKSKFIMKNTADTLVFIMIFQQMRLPGMAG